MKKTKLTRSLLAACSIVALSVVLSGCLHSSDDGDEMETDPPVMDSDGDGVNDDDDAFPDDPDETADSDGDGTGDNADAFPNDATETADSDGDGTGDNADAFPNDATETADSDGDGTGDNADAFPNDATETADSDGDGTGDNADAFPNDATETADSDGDGTGDNADAFPNDATETADSDGDGTGDNADAFPNDATETADSDGDGVGDNAQAEAERTAAAITKETAIAVEAAQTTDAGLGGSDATIGTAEGNYEGPTISRDNDGTTITVTVHGATDDDETFEKAEDLTSTTNPGQMLTRTHDAAENGSVMEEVAVVFTDIEAPTATAFGMVHTLDVRVDGETATEAMPNDALNVVDTNLAHVKADRFTAPAGTVGTTLLSFQHAVEDDDGTPDVDESRDAAEIPGMYEGAMGTFKCNAAAACTVTVDAMGVVSGVSTSNDWIFIPASDATVDVADTDYLHYGFWLQRTTDSDGVVEYDEVETFAGSSVDPSGSIASVEGTATYSGGAAGVYVKNVIPEDGVRSSTSGHFTADAVLNVAFGGNDVAVNDQNRLTGTINNFVLSGGEANTWSVDLQSDGDPNTDGVQADDDGVMAGTASGGVAGMDGSFTATFHGSVAAVDGVVPQPSSVVGEFNSNFSNGAVAGAFGAARHEE